MTGIDIGVLTPFSHAHTHTLAQTTVWRWAAVEWRGHHFTAGAT